MQPLRFDEILDSLDKLDPWLISLGIQPKTDRWHQAAKTIRAAKEQRERVERGEAPSTIRNYGQPPLSCATLYTMSGPS